MNLIKSNESVPNQWIRLNHALSIYRIGALTLSALSLVLAIIVGILATSDPVVVVTDQDSKIFFQGRHEHVAVTDEDIKAFIATWVTARYTWTQLDQNSIIRGIEPISTNGFLTKLSDQLGKRKLDLKEGQKLEEIAVNVRPVVNQKEALASFDRIVRINEIPIVVPSEVALDIVQGKRTRWNPLGLYVNGIVEHEKK